MPTTTHRFQLQHDGLIGLAKDLLKRLDTRALAVDPGPARQALAAFTGRLRVHAAMEQEALYPRLFVSADPEVVAKARSLFLEVGTLYDEFFVFTARWPDALSVKQDPETFCRDTMMMLHRLGERMKRENLELFPLVDAAASSGAD